MIALAVPARELLPYRLDHLESPRYVLQRFGDVLAELRQSLDPQHGQLVGPAIMTRSRSIVIRKGFANWPLTLEGFYGSSFSGARLAPPPARPPSPRPRLLELQFHLIQQPRRAFRALAVNLATELLDFELEIGDQRFMAGTIRLRFGGLGA